MKAWGLVHSDLFSVPVTVVGFAMLYMAVEWCAKDGVTPGSMANAIVSAIIRKFISSKPSLFLFEKLAVIGIVLADEFVHFRHVGAKREPSAHRPGLYKNVRIFQSRFVLEGIVIGAAEALDHVQSFGMPEAVDLGLVIEADGVHDQRVAFPMADRFAHPCGIRIRRVRPAICRNAA